jgi:hypothetical protein
MVELLLLLMVFLGMHAAFSLSGYCPVEDLAKM